MFFIFIKYSCTNSFHRSNLYTFYMKLWLLSFVYGAVYRGYEHTVYELYIACVLNHIYLLASGWFQWNFR